MPGYHPSAEALAPALLIIDLLRSALADAPARGQVHPDAATDAGMELLSIMRPPMYDSIEMLIYYDVTSPMHYEVVGIRPWRSYCNKLKRHNDQTFELSHADP